MQQFTCFLRFNRAEWYPHCGYQGPKEITNDLGRSGGGSRYVMDLLGQSAEAAESPGKYACRHLELSV
jgi:hypothetical protein